MMYLPTVVLALIAGSVFAEQAAEEAHHKDFDCHIAHPPTGAPFAHFVKEYTALENPIGHWYHVTFGPTGRSNQTFEFTSKYNLVLEFAALGYPGDQFLVSDAYTCLFKSNHPALRTRAIIGYDPEVTYNSALWSQGSIKLAAGYHSINIRLLCALYGNNSHAEAALRLSIDWQGECNNRGQVCHDDKVLSVAGARSPCCPSGGQTAYAA